MTFNLSDNVDMAESAHFKDMYTYRTFCNYVLRTNRHMLDDNGQQFLDRLLSQADSRIRLIRKGEIFYRAQLGSRPVRSGIQRVVVGQNLGQSAEKIAAPFTKKRMKPISGSATEGRVNSRGIPCLYVATDLYTAVAEMRGGLRQHVSVATLRAKRNLRVIDCTTEEGCTRRGFVDMVIDHCVPNQRDNYVWQDVSEAFSTPVLPSDMSADYAPTQMIADAFKLREYDGVKYSSRLGTGASVALFRVNDATVVTVDLYEIAKIGIPELKPL